MIQLDPVLYHHTDAIVDLLLHHYRLITIVLNRVFIKKYQHMYVIFDVMQYRDDKRSLCKNQAHVVRQSGNECAW